MCKKFGFALGVRRGNIFLVSRAIQNHYEKKSLKEIEKVGLKAFKGHFVWIFFRYFLYHEPRFGPQEDYNKVQLDY